MKKIIILLLAFLLSACSAVKPSKTLSSMQTEPAAETTVTETASPEEHFSKETDTPETVITVQKEDSSGPPVDERSEQKPAPETTTI